MNIQELRKIGRDKLVENNIDDVYIKIDSLLKFVLKMNKTELIVNQENELSKKDENKFLKHIEEIINGKPIQYITKVQEFMNLKFYVDENVLIPQPDTEILVEEVMKKINEIKEKKIIKILDLCTGSGTIAISIKKYFNDNVEVYATDISEKAIKIAKKNAKNNDVKVKFILSDMFENIKENDFDIIVSNPPYIESKTISTLSKEVQNEPKIALDGGEDGLEFYKIIAQNADKFLKEKGQILLEIGYNQKESVMKIFENTRKYFCISCIKDLSNNDRVLKFVLFLSPSIRKKSTLPACDFA